MSRAIDARFEAMTSEYGEFKRITNKLSNRPDLHAFMMLDRLDPTATGDLITHVDGDVMYLNVDRDLLENQDDDFIRDLTRCGVSWDDQYDCLYMFT